jgi:hypothetical protein
MKKSLTPNREPATAPISVLGMKPKTKPKLDAFYAVKPASIRCCPSVENFRANTEIHSIALEEFVLKNNLHEYTSSIKMTPEQLKDVWLDKTFHKHPATELEAELFDPNYTDQFVLVNMGEEMGQGLFLAPDARKIAAGTIVLMYSGEYCLSDCEKKDYGLIIDPSFDHETHCVLLKPKVRNSIDAASSRNLSRFIQGAPDQMELAEAISSKEIIDQNNIASKVACANLQQRVVIYQGFPVLFLQAFRDINPGEILTFSYGMNYFNLRGGCKVYTVSGQIIGFLEKNRLISSCSATEIAALPPANRLDLVVAKKILYTRLNQEARFDFKMQFILSTCHALSTSIKMLSNTQHCAIIKKTLDSFKAENIIEKQYALLRELINTDVCKKELIFLRRHLIKTCYDFNVHYQAAKHDKNIDTPKMN